MTTHHVTSLSSGEVTSGYLGDASVLSGSIGSGQVASGHLASGLLSNIGLTSGAVQSGHIASGNTIPDPVFPGFVDFKEIATPATPSSGMARAFGTENKTFPFVAVKDDVGAVLQLTRDSVFVCKNVTGGILPLGTAVYVTGSSGNVPTVAKAKSNSDVTMPCIGIILQDVANGAFGRVMFAGVLTGIDTSLFTEGDLLYVSDVTAGGLVNVAPVFPNETQRVAVVLLSDAVNGLIQVLMGSAAVPLASGTVQSGMVGLGAITSGNVASGAIGSMQIMSGAQITIAARIIDWIGYVTSEPISGGLAVGLNKSGQAQVAMASIPTRMPAFGVCEANVASGVQISPLLYGRTLLPAVNFSGNTGQPIWVGTSGLLVPVVPNSSGFIQQKMGLAISQSGANVIPDQDFFQVQA